MIRKSLGGRQIWAKFELGMLGLGSGFNPSEVTQAEFGFKFDSPKLRGRINLNEFERI